MDMKWALLVLFLINSPSLNWTSSEATPQRPLPYNYTSFNIKVQKSFDTIAQEQRLLAVISATPSTPPTSTPTVVLAAPTATATLAANVRVNATSGTRPVGYPRPSAPTSPTVVSPEPSARISTPTPTPSSVAPGPDLPPNKISRTVALVLVLVFIAAIVAVVFIWIGLRCIREQKPGEEGREKHLDEEWENSLLHLTNLPKRFTYKELKAATDSFNKKLGGGGFGSVFQGTLRDSTKVAVKRLDRFGQGRKEFLAEVKTIGSIHHFSLARLVGFCAENSHKLLVYDYMSNGSLDKWIFNRNPETALEWQLRKKIILSIAKGITYLHEDCKLRIAHLDIKPQNILLDEEFNAKLSDFGLARLIDRHQSQITTQMRGTRGYMAPEWLSRKITEKVDVYSFGVVILEIICGRRNLDLNQPEEDDILLLAVVKEKAEANELIDLVDKCSEDMQQHAEEAVEMMRIGIWCLHNDPNRRPLMSMVVKVLEGVMTMETFCDYGFLTFAGAEAPADVVMVLSDPQPASVLSGPR